MFFSWEKTGQLRITNHSDLFRPKEIYVFRCKENYGKHNFMFSRT